VRIDVLFAAASLGPSDVAGRVVAVIDVLPTTFTLVAAVPPKVTVAPARKPLPVMVTEVPPTIGPAFGVIEPTVGAGLLTA